MRSGLRLGLALRISAVVIFTPFSLLYAAAIVERNSPSATVCSNASFGRSAGKGSGRLALARGDWVLRPGGYALDHVLVGVTLSSSVQTFSKSGTNAFQPLQSFLVPTGLYGVAEDMSFGNGVIWVAHDEEGVGYAVSYPFVISAVPEASVSVELTNGSAVVSWSGRWLEGSADLAWWQRLTNAPQPYLEPLTNAPHYFRAVK